MTATAIKQPGAARQDLGADAIVEIEYAAEVILRLVDSENLSVEMTPVRGLALRIRQLAGVALGAIDPETQTIEKMRKVLIGQQGLDPCPRSANAVRDQSSTGSPHDDAASAQLVQTPARGQGPQFADIAHLVEPGRVPTIDDCVRALDEVRTQVELYFGRAQAHHRALRALLRDIKVADSTSTSRGMAGSDADAVLAVVESLRGLLEIFSDEMEFIRTGAGMATTPIRKCKASCVESAAVGTKGGAA